MTITKIALATGVFAASAFAQTDMTAAESHGDQNADFSKAELHVWPVQGNIYMLVGDGANMTLQVGKQGAVLVNTGFDKMSDKAIAAIKKISERPLQYVINTNSYPDSTSGNGPVKLSGTTITGANVTNDIRDSREGAQILAEENVLTRMSAPTGTKSPTPPDAWPTDTFLGREKTLFFNGEGIEIMHQPNALTDGDSFVFFRKSDVVSAGDIFNTDGYPVIDVEKGGTIEGTVLALTRLVDMSIVEHEEEGGTLVVPGHGHLCDQAEVVEYRDMVAIVRDRVKDAIKRGLTLEQTKAEKLTRDYDPTYGHNSYWTPEMFIEAAYKSLKPGK
ncbi:MAG TPA: MBL fold metallo-hydrolase [Bryobacteraceae bacterium]|jgi:glyoxylase-like metal-dependent hydrolase (beta-lactamase superfamily II)|nr:MBL fold metallo-hydrolase [Bryobacteraceae bacterium]